MSFRRALMPVSLAALVLGACGSDDGGDLPPQAEAGRSVIRDNGCSSCHGANGQGGVGPAFEGLYGTEVTFEDGSTAIADDAYITESIKDPGAKKVEGYRVPMPANNLDDDQIADVIAFIRAIGPEDGAG
jgi:cytochrome c oxidase subunit 2